jgi:hypothetical protein
MKLYLKLLLISIIFNSCQKDNPTDSGTTTPKRTVQYSISGTDCFVYCRGTNGAAQNFFHQNSSWTYTYEAGAHDTLLLVAQNTSGAPAAIAGIIRLNGAIIAADTSYCPINGTVIVSDTL